MPCSSGPPRSRPVYAFSSKIGLLSQKGHLLLKQTFPCPADDFNVGSMQPKSPCCGAPLQMVHDSAVWAVCSKCRKRCVVPEDWFCGKCEQEKGNYPASEWIPSHSLHCPRRFKRA